MPQCIAARADGSRCRMNAQRKLDGTPAEGLCGRHHHQLIAGESPPIDAVTGRAIPRPEDAAT